MNNKRLLAGGLALALLFIVWKLVPWPSIMGRTSPGLNDGRLKISATISPLADMVKNVGGTHVDVSTILPPGASPHAFEPTPQQAIAVQSADLVFAIGHGFDGWAGSLVANADHAKLATADAGIQLRDLSAQERDEDEPGMAQDPHYWLSIPNAKIMAANIAASLSAADPGHAADYAKNLDLYVAKLTETDAYLRSRLSPLKNRNLLTHHNAWGYFAKEYGLAIVGTFEVAPGKEPTAKQLAALQDIAKRSGLKTVYVEPQLSDQSVRPFVQDLKLNVATLDPEGGSGNMGYLDLMRYNADTLAKNQD